MTRHTALQQIDREKESAMADDHIELHEEPEGKDYETLDEEVSSGLLWLTVIDAQKI
jgi:hypothetical protein